MINKNKKKYYIGIDVGGSSVKIGIFKTASPSSIFNKKLVDSFSIVTVISEKNNERQLIGRILDAVEDYCENNEIGLTKSDIAGIGFAVPGPVLNNKLLHGVNLNWKKKYDIVRATKNRFGSKVNVKVLNDANAAALGEYQVSLKGKYNSMCLITLGTGIGTGIVIDGKLIEGKHGIAGEVAHIRVDYSKDAIRCNCGNLGCVETMVASGGIIRIYYKLRKKRLNPSFYNDRDNALVKEIVDKARKGDKIAIKTFDIALNYLSQLIKILMHVYDPEVVLIGGGMSNAGSIIIDLVKKHLKSKMFMSKDLPKIMIAKLKNKAGIYGAVAQL